MSNLNQFLSGVQSRSPVSIVNAISTNGWSETIISAPQGVKEILSGALTAATLATLLTVTGQGILNIAAIYNKDATARTLRLQIVIDGVTVFDSTSASIATAGGRGGVAVGYVSGSVLAGGAAVPFNTSLVIKAASSLTETDKIAIGVAYITV